MPDILIQCPECSREYKVSEYASVDSMTCITCGAQLARPAEAPQCESDRLRLKGHMTPPSLPGVGLAPALPDVPDALAIAGGPVVCAAPHVDVHLTDDVKDPPRWLAPLVGALVLGVLIGFQYFSSQLESYFTYYVWLRNGLALAGYGLVVLLAFQDHWGPGFLCLLIPPYSFMYTASSVESGILRGVFFGMVLVFAAEVYFLPDHAALLSAGEMVGGLIQNVDGLILKASESPI